ncbi:hypothetical protein Tco_1427549 [Tanacetum coccineum]
MILESFEHGPLIWPTVEDNRVIRMKKYAELSAAEKIQADYGIKATNIILQGLPANINSLVNHHRVAKDLWEGVQLLMARVHLCSGKRILNEIFQPQHFHNNSSSCVSLTSDAGGYITMMESPFGDTGFAVLVFSLGDDPISCLNKAMAFLTAVASSRFPSTNNQLRTSSNPRNQATIQDGRVTVQQVQGRQGQNYSGTTYKGNATSSRGNTTSGQARVVKCYNCQEAQEAGQILDEEQLAFLADPGIPADQVQTIIPHNAAFQTEDLDTYDSDCDDLSTAQAVLSGHISKYVLNYSEVPNF